MLETWGEENGQHGSRPNVAARAVMVGNSWFTVLVARVAEYLGCEASTLAHLVDEQLGIRAHQFEGHAPLREGTSVLMAKLFYSTARPAAGQNTSKECAGSMASPTAHSDEFRLPAE